MKRPFRFSLSSKKRFTVVMVLVAVIAILATSLIAIWLDRIAGLRIPSLVTIRTVGVEAYWDENLTNKTEFIDWDTIRPGTIQDVTVYLRSISNVETKLTIETANWNPANLSDYVNITWNYNGAKIHPNETVQVVLSLSVSSSSSFIMYLVTSSQSQFSFEIDISTHE